MSGDAAPSAPRQRLDKWLWQARFFKTRSLSAAVIQAGHCRVDGARVGKPATPVRPGAVLTFTQAERVRVVRILRLAVRRGPASEAATLYEDLTPSETPDPSRPQAVGNGRPTGRDRRNLDLSRGRWLE